MWVTVFLHALYKYCGKVIQVKKSGVTYVGRTLYEVVINGSSWGNSSKSVTVIDAGQDASEAPVGFALYLIEQLVACMEYQKMIDHIRWVILPSTNPDGMEYSRAKHEYWKKNTRLINNLSYGVDITRNFEVAWADCSAANNSFSQDYPGHQANSENETIFIRNTIQKYSESTKAYVSLRRDGHGIFYPFANENSSNNGTETAKEVAGYVASKVNQEIFLHLFQNDSIFNANIKPHCGHSVDYVFKTFAVPYAFEMRMFVESSNEITSKFHRMPKGYGSSLTAEYFAGIKELYRHIRKTTE
ncbi:zinc carboxypeptidase A 1-like isoform X2 [Aricia agestis]|uniref:zinc carboxypeptidase A 1-like isoform X2 n=1 Tax=Aricia agestis TaxID=91739 RepID=UPI001C205ED2|nr:zinc carboxypeptidase A 1-like isoform X2 [Aricia agestis]